MAMKFSGSGPTGRTGSLGADFEGLEGIGEGGPLGEDLIAERVIAAVLLDAPLAQHR